MPPVEYVLKRAESIIIERLVRSYYYDHDVELMIMMAYLGSLQKDEWSRKGRTRAAFIILAIATISHICQ